MDTKKCFNFVSKGDFSVLFVLAFSLGFYLGFFTPSAFSAENSQKPNTSLKLGLNWQPEPEFGGFYAVESSFEKSIGRPLTIIPGNSQTPTSQMVASQAYDFGIVTSGEILAGIEKGSDLIPLFAIYQTSPMVFIAHGSQSFQSVEDLLISPTAVLSIQQGYPGITRLLRSLEKTKDAQGNPQKVKAQIVPYRGGIGHFLLNENHAQQGFIHSEFVLIQEAIEKKNQELTLQNKERQAKGLPPLPLEKPPVALRLNTENYHPYAAVLATTKKFLLANPKLVKKVVETFREGWISYLQNPTAVNLRMHQLNPTLSIDTMNKGAALQKELILPKNFKPSQIGTMTKARWLGVADQLQSVDVLPKTLKSGVTWDKAVSELCQDYCL